MIKYTTICSLIAGLLVLPAVAVGQDLGPYPVERVSSTPEKDLISIARQTTTSYNFLKLTTHARSAGIGDAYSAVGNDLSAAFYNPAGITQIEQSREFTGSYARWLSGSQIGTFALGIKTRVATFSVNAVYFSTEQIKETTVNSPTGTGRMMQFSDMAIGLAFARQVTNKLSVGGNLRWVQEDLDLKSYGSVAINFGTLFYTGFRSARLAMALHNLGGDKDVIVLKARFPMAFNLAGAMEVYGDLGDPVSVTLAVEQVFNTDYATRYNMGTEIWLQNMLAVRAGYKTRHDSESWTVGAGLKYKLGAQQVKVDVSYSNAEAFQEHPMRLSVGVGF